MVFIRASGLDLRERDYQIAPNVLNIEGSIVVRNMGITERPAVEKQAMKLRVVDVDSAADEVSHVKQWALLRLSNRTPFEDGLA